MFPTYALMAANSSDFISRHAAQNAVKPVLKVCLLLLEWVPICGHMSEKPPLGIISNCLL